MVVREKKMKCYLCNENEANSVEHIIPNAIGGKIKAIILCRECNSKYGDSYEVALAKSLLLFSNWINHPRDRGSIPNLPCKMINADGKEVSVEREAASKELNALNRNKYINSGNSLKFSFSIFGKGGEQRFRKEHKQTLTNWGKKHGWSKERLAEELQKTEAILDVSRKKIENPSINMTISFGGKEVYLSCLKTATNFYIQKGYDRQYIENAIRIIKDQCNNDIFKVANSYYPDNFFPKNGIFHTLYLKGDSKNRMLLCLISYYSVFQSLLILNANYDGIDFEERYCYDIWNEKEVNFTKSLDIDTATIQTVIENGNEHLKLTQEQVVKMMNIFMERFVINKDTANIGIQTLLNLTQEVVKELALRNDLFDKQQFTKIIKTKLSLRPKELSLLKDKDIAKYIDESEGLFEEYLRQKTYFNILFIISKKYSEIVVTDIFINKINAKNLDWDLIRQKILEDVKTIKFDDEKLNTFIPDLLSNIVSNMDSNIATMKDTIIRWSNYIIYK